MRTALRMRLVAPSATLGMAAKAADLRRQGKAILDLSAGEPDFNTPQHIKDAAKKAIDDNFTRYTPVPGIPTLREAVTGYYKQIYGVPVPKEAVIATNGGKQALYNLFLAVLIPGDEVLVPAPYWVSYPDMTILAGGVPVVVECGIEQGYKLSPAQLEAAITPKTRMLVINSPSNPTGAVYTLEELKALGDVLKKHPNILVASDDMYEHVMLGDTKFYNILNACPELKEQVIVLNGVSKAYSMTGWRIGYAAGPQKLIKAMENIQSQSTSNPTSISQVAAQAALEGDQGCITPMLKAFNERHVYVVDRFNKMRGLKCLRAGGAFYAFVDAREAIKLLAAEGKIAGATDMALGTYLLEAQDVAVVPGSAFGAEGYFRISFATSMQNLEKALDRIEKALA